MTTVKRFVIKTKDGYYGPDQYGVDLEKAKTWRTREAPEGLIATWHGLDDIHGTDHAHGAEVAEITVVRNLADEPTELDEVKAKIQDLREYLLSQKFHCGDEMDGYVNVQDVLNRLA